LERLRFSGLPSYGPKSRPVSTDFILDERFLAAFSRFLRSGSGKRVLGNDGASEEEESAIDTDKLLS